ncbi:MAG: hypothetical protein ABIP39_10245, partial [Polyangiaceae bacterium]
MSVFLVCVAVLVGLPSIAFPFGPDQGLYFYVGREWLHGSIPYRDVFDHKTPGIYVVHAVCILLLGEHTSSIRVADLLCVLALGAIVARLATPRSAPVPRGFIGLGCGISSMLHYGFFNFWDTAQTEIWYTTLGLAAITAARQVHSLRNAALAGGVLGGLALLMKPPSVWYVGVAFVVLLLRLREGGKPFRIGPYVRASLQFGVAAAAVIAVTLAYFAVHHALGAMIDIVVGANRYYIEHERGVSTLGEALERFRHVWEIFFPISALFVLVPFAALAANFAGRGEGLGSQYILAAALLVAGVGALAMQQKFYWIHWFTTMGAVTFLFIVASNHIRLILRERIAENAIVLACALVIGVAFATSHACKHRLQEPGEWVYALWTGAMPREAFAKKFVVEDFQF